MERYQRQIILKEFGEIGQMKLLAAKVLVIGAGGLGCPVMQYLAAAGVGTIGIIDDDIVSLTNLHRQVLYGMHDIGKSKAERAAAILRAANPEITIMPYNVRITNKNAFEFIEPYDVIVDATDNFSTRYMINDACVILNKPMVYGAISKWEGQVTIFNGRVSGEKGANYRDLFPVPPKENEIANCAEAGVIGVLPGIIGSLQGGEVIKLITGIGNPLINCLLTYNMLTNEMYTWEIAASAQTKTLLPKDKDAFLNNDYEWSCSVNNISEIEASDFDRYIKNESISIIDVREKGEQPLINEFQHFQIPLSQLKGDLPDFNSETIITICQSGKRSLQAAQILTNTFPTKKIFSLQGGLIGWKQQLQRQTI